MRNRLLALLSLGAFGAFASTATAQSRPLAADPASLNPGDSLRVEVWRHPDFSGVFVVGPDNNVMHPLFRGVRVGGVPFATAEANVRQVLSQYDKEPQFVFEPFLRVTVSGEVFRPQVLALPPQTSIVEAVTRTGGPNQYAARNRARIIRMEAGGARREFKVNLDRPEEGLSLGPIRSGDMILLDRKRSFVKDILVPTISVAGSIAALGLLIDRYNNN
jgi:polysaccharide biosynthesis/export protein